MLPTKSASSFSGLARWHCPFTTLFSGGVPAYVVRYLFLLERVHLVRAPFVNRWRDPMYMASGIIVSAGLLGTMGWQMVDGIAEMSPKDGKCRTGFHYGAGILIMCWDTTTNLFLTSIFVWQLRSALPLPRPQIPSTTYRASHSSAKGLSLWIEWGYKTVRGSSLSGLQVMLVRNIIGAVFMLMSSLCINILMVTQDFAKLGHICMLLCLFDGQYS